MFDFRRRWALSPWAFWPIFLALSAYYGAGVFPQELNSYSAAQLQEVVTHSVTFLDRAYLPLDSAGYLATAHESFGTIVRSMYDVGHVGFGLFSNLTVILLGKLALKVWPSHPLAFVAIVNHVLFVGTVLHCRAICRHYGVWFERFLPLVLVNPLVLFTLYTLNKEAIGLFLVAATVRYSLEDRKLPVVGLVLVALYTRNVLFGFCVLMLFRKLLMRIRWWQLLVAASLVWPAVLYVTHDQPFGSQFGSLDSLTRYFNQQLSRVLTFALDLMKVPLGYVLAWVIVTGIDVASPAFNIRYYRSYADHLNYAQITLQVSSIVFICLIALTLFRARLQAPKIEPLFLFFVFTLFTGVFPLSQHRYLLPAFPLLIVAYLVATRTEAEHAADALPAAALAT